MLHELFPCGWISSHRTKAGYSSQIQRNFISKCDSYVVPILQISLLRMSETLLNNRRSTTHNTYLQKWKRFLLWCQPKQLTAVTVPLPLILDYVLELKESDLSISSIKVHLVAITAFHPTCEGTYLFAHPVTKHFLTCIRNIYPEV